MCVYICTILRRSKHRHLLKVTALRWKHRHWSMSQYLYMLHGRTGMRGWACHTTMFRGRMWGRFWPTCWTRNRWRNATFSRIVPIVPRKIYIFAADKQWPGPLKMCHLHENPPSTVSVFFSKWFNQYIVTYCSKEGSICLRWAWYLGCFGTARLPIISIHIPS